MKRDASPEDRKAYHRAYREQNPDRFAEYNRKHRSQADQRTAFLAIWKHAAACKDCGYRAHHAALDFDHVRGEKVIEVGKMVYSKWDTLYEEIAKCDVVCANCHRIRTYERRRATIKER